MKKVFCPDCGAPLHTYWVPGLDPGDVEPAAVCTNPDCDYEY